MKLAGFVNIDISTPGVIDIDIVHNAHKNGNKDLPRYLTTMFKHASEKELNNFQQFITLNNLS